MYLTQSDSPGSSTSTDSVCLVLTLMCAFSVLTLLVSDEVLAWLSVWTLEQRGNDLHVAQLMSLPPYALVQVSACLLYTSDAADE